MIVKKITSEMNRRDVTCTTYQMRNCFQQFYDGVASELDAHCYFQHQFAANLCHASSRVLDVCCGRGMLIPFLRYGKAQPEIYVGVDIAKVNAVFATGRDPRRAKEQKEWGFEIKFVESNVEAMAEPVRAVCEHPFDVIVYTSAIEHMNPDSQVKSLVQCAELAGPKSVLYLSCPVTPEGQSGYDCQYAAHVYEPSYSELHGWLDDAGWDIDVTIGLCTTCTKFRSTLKGMRLKGAEYLYRIQPRAQALCSIGAQYPEAATEIALVCKRKTP